MGVGFPAQTSRQLHRSPADIPKVPILHLLPDLPFWNFFSSVPFLWPDFVLCPHLPPGSLRCPLLPYFPNTLTATQNLPPFSVPQPCPLSHLTESWNRVSLHHLCHVLWFRSKSEVPPTFKKKGLKQVWIWGHLKVCLPQVPNRSRLDTRSKERKDGTRARMADSWVQGAGAWRVSGRPWGKPLEVALSSSRLLHRQMARHPMSITRGQFRHRVVTSEDLFSYQ